MEQIIVIAVFAICAAVCVRIISASHIMTTDAVDTRHALMQAESAAESHKAFAGNLALVAQLMGGSHSVDTLTIYYDQNWQPTNGAGAAFVLHLAQNFDDEHIVLADISVRRILTGDELLHLSAAVRRGAAVR